jgi:hypothetical protein
LKEVAVVSLQKTFGGLLVALVCFTLAGCGSSVKRVVVTGKILEDGQPLKLSGPAYEMGGAGIDVRFNPADDALRDMVQKLPISLSTRAKLDGTFVVDGGDGKGIPVGKYKVSLVHQNMMMDRRDRAAAATRGDLFGGRFTATKTPFEFDIQEAKEIVLEVGQAGGPAPKS